MPIIAGAIILTVIAIGAFVFMKKPASTSLQTSVTQEETAPAQGSQSSIKSLLGLGKNQTCEVTYPDGGTSGTIYVAANKVRGNFTMTVEGKPFESSMIQDGTYGYFWSGTQGTKMKIDQTASASPTATTQKTADLDEKVDMKCGSWNVDDSMFTPPGNVTFTDLSAILQKQPTGSSVPNISSYCAQITDPQAKASCESAASDQ